MKAYVITIEGNEVSENGSRTCIESSWQHKNEFSIKKFDASIPENVDYEMQNFLLEWDYPWSGEVLDFASGLKKTAYQTRNPKARIACALSHYRLWKKSVEEMEDILVLEHDAVFISKVPYNRILDTQYGIIGLNDPRGATRKSSAFHSMVQNGMNEVTQVPRIDAQNVPQGLAGNSAYIIKPWAADEMINLVNEYGLWPNDAIMCYQLFPLLGVTRKYYTRLQGLQSTTTQ